MYHVVADVTALQFVLESLLYDDIMHRINVSTFLRISHKTIAKYADYDKEFVDLFNDE